MTEQKRIWLSPPHMGGEEQRFVSEAFASNWIAPLGPHVDAFEAELAAYLGVPQVVALSSGTAAIHLALLLLGVQRGDAVLCASFTFAASANPIVYVGAEPVFVGSEKETWCVCPQSLEDAIAALVKRGRRPKALVAVDLFGVGAHYRELVPICERYGIPLIEDAAEALGSSYDGRKLGGYGQLGVLSFNGNKIITTSGGGALIAHTPEQAQRARFLATQARDPAPHYQHSHIGYNYRMSNVVAAIGRGQLRVLDEWVRRRRAIGAFYREALGQVQGIHFLDGGSLCFWNNWLSVLLLDPERYSNGPRAIMESLSARNIESRPVWKPLHLQPVFEACQYFGTRFEEQVFDRALCLPSGSALGADDLNNIVVTVRSALNRTS